MPAVTVDDLSKLPRIPAAGGAETRPRAIRQVSTAPKGFEGEGFPVRRAFAGVDLSALDPFIHLDQIGEIEYAP
ncbi:MAG: pirin family protein, partial [Acidimicrobiales bacterium]